MTTLLRALKPAGTTAETFANDSGNSVTFNVECILDNSAAKQGEQDKWSARVWVDDKRDRAEIFEYSTGTGLRAIPVGMASRTPLPFRATVDEWNASRPVTPSARDVLICLGSDLSTALDMPRAAPEAMDYLQDEFGHEGKASDLLRLINALQSNADKISRLCAAARITPEAFADFCHNLDA